MKKEENKELLTTGLYMEISADKSEQIANLKERKISILKNIREKLEELSRLRDEKKKLVRQIRITKGSLFKLRTKKFKLTKELGLQKRLANKLNRQVTKEDTYIDVNKFYPENNDAKKR